MGSNGLLVGKGVVPRCPSRLGATTCNDLLLGRGGSSRAVTARCRPHHPEQCTLMISWVLVGKKQVQGSSSSPRGVNANELPVGKGSLQQPMNSPIAISMACFLARVAQGSPSISRTIIPNEFLASQRSSKVASTAPGQFDFQLLPIWQG